MSDSQSVWSRLDGPMTPALVADIRAETEQMGSPIARRVLALADSLDAAWAALETERTTNRVAGEYLTELRERVDRAEAQNQRLLDQMVTVADVRNKELIALLELHVAALARVREECARIDPYCSGRIHAAIDRING